MALKLGLSIDEGFDFLGFNIRQYEGKSDICLVKPSKKAIQRHLMHIKMVLSKDKQARADDIVRKLNPIIQGWANYYKYSNASTSYHHVEYQFHQAMY